LLLQLVEIDLALGGPRRARATIDSLARARSGPPSLAAARGRLARLSGNYARADSLYLSLIAGQAAHPLDDFMLAYYRMSNSMRPGGVMAAAAMDSLLRYLDEHTSLAGRAGYTAGYLRLLADAAQIARPLLDGQTTPAREGLVVIRERAAAGGYKEQELYWTTVLGNLATSDHHSRDARREWTRARTLAQWLGDVYRVAIADSYLAEIYSQLGDVGTALCLAEQAAGPLEALGDHLALAWNTLGLGWYAWLRGEVEKAETTLELAISRLAKHGDRWGQSLALNDLGIVYSSTGRPDQALATYRRSLALGEEIQSYQLQSFALENIAGMHHRLGQYDEALAHYQRALAASREIDHLGQIVSVLGSLGNTSLDLGRPAQANVFYDEAVRVARREGLRRHESHALVNLAGGLAASGSRARAVELLQQALDIALDGDDKRLAMNVRIRLGRRLLEEKHYQEALNELQRADSLLVELGDISGRLKPLLLIARAQLGLGKPAASLDTADSLDGVARSFGATLHRGLAQTIRAEALAAMGRKEAAREACRDGMALCIEARRESWRPGLVSTARERREVLEAGYEALAILMRIGAVTGDPQGPMADVEEAFSYLQQLKAQSLLERLQVDEVFLKPQIDAELAAEERRRKLRVVRLRESCSAAPSADNQLELAEAEAAYQEVRSRVLEADRRFRRAQRRQPLSSPEIRQLLGGRDDQLILDFFMGPDDEPARIFMLDGSKLSLFELAAVQEVRQQVEFFLALLARPPVGPHSEQATKAAAASLYRTLLGPLHDHVVGAERLIVAADGVLHRLPFAALVVPQGGDNESAAARYLAETCAVSCIPSLTILADLEESQRRRREREMACDLAIWPGPRSGTDDDPASGARPDMLDARKELRPLPFAAIETAGLDRRFQRSRIFTSTDGRSSGKTLLAQAGLLGKSRVLHLIAHGLFDDRRPWTSGIWLDRSPAGDEEDFLTITDVYYLDFTADLVTLAACETARGAVLRGEGIQGFAQALFGSGSTSVLATLWRIDDLSTARFMLRFYEHLAAGSSKAGALAATQREFLQNTTLSHPFYWSPYVILGEADAPVPLRVSRNVALSAKFWFIAAAVLLIGALGFARQQVRRREPLT
jgi:CHAT domain-containing protein/Tfp pilus assembly protein PilF